MGRGSRCAHAAPRAVAHCAHLTVALLYLTRHATDEGARRIRDVIQKYNHACGDRNPPPKVLLP